MKIQHSKTASDDQDIATGEFGPNPKTLAIRYQFIRWVFWGIFVISFVTLGSAPDEISITFFILLFLSAILSAFSPCPHCGETIGIKWHGPLVFGNCFGGWCLHCGKKLFGKTMKSIRSVSENPS